MADGDVLSYNDVLTSQSGDYFLVMQSDCNLVLYDQTYTAIWAAGTNGRGAILPCSFYMKVTSTTAGIYIIDNGDN